MRKTRRDVVGSGEEPIPRETAKQSIARLTARTSNHQKSIECLLLNKFRRNLSNGGNMVGCKPRYFTSNFWTQRKILMPSGC
jgi:hypothetical protein